MKHIAKFAAACGSLLLAAPAFAHTGDGAHGLAHGLAHPMTGLDHLLAMVAVGLWAATRERGQAWQAPATFLSALALGGVGGLLLGASALVEPVVALSLVVLGAMVVFSARVPASFGLGVIGLLALFHGYAHGGEATGGALGYFAGFLIASALLHLAGFEAGRMALSGRLGRIASGAGLGLAGLALTLG